MLVNAVVHKLKSHSLFSDFFTPKGIRQFKKYLITGFTSFGIEYTLFALLYKIVFKKYYILAYSFTNNILSTLNIHLKADSFRAILANGIVYVIIFWFNFYMNRTWSFESKDNLGRQLRLYGMLFAFNLLVGNVVLMYVLSDILHISPLIAKFFIMGVIVSWNFIIYKKIIYK